MIDVVQGGDTRTAATRRHILVGVVLGALLAAVAVPERAAAQRTDDQRRRELVDELLRSLIESELQQRNAQPVQPRFEPAPQPAARTNVAPTPRVVNAPTREMTEARRILADVQRDAEQLATLLSNDVSRVPGIRTYLGDVLKLRARAAFVAQRSAQLNDHRELLADLQNFDRDWRVLAHRLQSLGGLDRRAEQSIERLNGHAQALSKIFNMRPQVDYRELLQKAAALAASLRTLIEDIEIELGESTQRRELLLDGRRVEQQAISVMNTVADGTDYDVIAAEYQKFQTLWAPYASRLRPVENRYLERAARRVREADAAIHTLLWLPQELDRTQILHLTELLKKDVDDFYARAPLRLLIELPENERVLPIADQFFGVCENFIRNVESGENPSTIVDDFGFIESSWQEFDRLLRPVNSRAAQQVLQQIQERMQAIRTALKMQDGPDRRVSVDLAASLDNLSEQLQQSIGHWLAFQSVSFRNEALRDTAEFASAAHQLHVDVLAGADTRAIRQNADRLHELWRKVHQWVSRCETDDRMYLLRLSSRITPALVDLRTQVQ
ncbi:MAG TPA: hypothetical protein VML55_14505 [Planctomycetaceae bacterium]|nr:hypothetical protein [Planctomycetaceae bacterium]